jgi:hypothetical protein
MYSSGMALDLYRFQHIHKIWLFQRIKNDYSRRGGEEGTRGFFIPKNLSPSIEIYMIAVGY